jgi:hypothetical protein
MRKKVHNNNVQITNSVEKMISSFPNKTSTPQGPVTGQHLQLPYPMAVWAAGHGVHRDEVRSYRKLIQELQQLIPLPEDLGPPNLGMNGPKLDRAIKMATPKQK